MQDELIDLLGLLLHANATIKLHNRATGDCLPVLPPMLITALAAVPSEDFDRLAERTRQTLCDAIALAECQHPVVKRNQCRL